MPTAKRPAKFPVPHAWAPPYLIERYLALDERLSHGGSGEPDERRWELDEVDVRLRLISDDRMKRVWSSPSLRRLANDLLEELVFETVLAVHTFDDSPIRRTKAEHHQNFSEVAKKTRALARQIKHDLGKRSAATTKYLETRHLKDRLRGLGLPRGIQEIVLHTVKAWLSNHHHPTFTHVLEDLEEAAFRESRVLPLLRKPGVEAAKGHYVARHLNAFFRKHLHKPLHDQVTTITNVVTGLNLELDSVRKICSNKSN